MFALIIFFSLLGLCVSLYAFFIERSLAKNPAYKPLCDISDRISCSKPIKSEYGKIFLVSNSIAGIGYYVAVIVAAFLNAPFILLIFTSLGILATCFFCYLLFCKVKTICLVCIGTYLINIILWLLALIHFFT
jgi:vitamin-K-epoxide reductase (warfarin-sensitive)